MKIKRKNFSEKGTNLVMTVKDWTKAGFPGRHPDDVKELFETHCLGGPDGPPCELYDPEGRLLGLGLPGTCGGCGCHVSADATEWSNAVSYPAKPCPAKKFGIIDKERTNE